MYRTYYTNPNIPKYSSPEIAAQKLGHVISDALRHFLLTRDHCGYIKLSTYGA